MAREPQVVVVTGATDGIGRQAAYELAKAGRRVVVHGRNKPRVDAAIEWIRAGVADADLDGVSFDLGSLAEVRRGAGLIAQRHPAIAVLIHNAGIFAPERTESSDGFELTFAVCHLAHFLLADLLLPQLRAAAPARVINVSSVAHTRGQIRIEDLNYQRGYSGYGAYSQAKLANVMHAASLAERHPATELAAYSLHPGVIDTKLLRTGFGPIRAGSLGEGVRTMVRLALAEAVDDPSGSYFSGDVATPPSPIALDRGKRDALWAASARMCGLD